MKRNQILIMSLAFILNGCVSSEQKDKTISISGAFALYPMTIKWTEEYKKENPDVRFNISAGGAGKGMADALAGTVDLGMFSREILDEEKKQGVWWVGLCIDAVLPTISSENPYIEKLKKRGITRSEFEEIFIRESIKNWNDLVPGESPLNIQVYTRSDACGAAGTWALYLGGMQEDLKGIGIHGDPGLAEAVVNDISGIGFNNTAYIYDISSGKKHPGLEVIPIDINENGTIDPDEDFYDCFEDILSAIAEEKYPSPPARELYFVSKSRPEKKATLDFILWSLTEGQQFVKEAGYVPIIPEKLKEYMKKVD